jgi:hypothetical protein
MFGRAGAVCWAVVYWMDARVNNARVVRDKRLRRWLVLVWFSRSRWLVGWKRSKESSPLSISVSIPGRQHNNTWTHTAHTSSHPEMS